MSAPSPCPFLDDFPEQPGVYRFYGKAGELLYVGKSINLRQRIRSHYQARHRHHRAHRLAQLTDHIQVTTTAGELGALLLENREIKQRQPIFNRRQRRYRQLHTWLLEHNRHGFLVPRLHSPNPHSPRWQQDCFGLYRSPRQAQQAMEHWIREGSLCPAICGLERHQGPCFSYQLGRCQGACCGMESAQQHNQRLQAALHQHQIQAWPYEGVLVIRESGCDHDDYHLIQQWCHLATLDHPPASTELQSHPLLSFDLDSYRMLLHFLNRGVEHFVMT